ncbi:DNA dC-_dU-editing enzyme APOBEC-3A isoform X1 [Physeter macrocephalus]|uniref:DNA dC->dU-editing enzyme APOBEC-3G n=1 Tax=Physeter macrocephalus TaxID=9755 RepID=A0A455BEV3_PHYMC|nr:DNA dC->dU-editing enzyme APOBEC-3A isoform X1 [Physeter catodon]|eukprot:XP_028346448.1 DNA dC-_dU-editing enzyme APOBEC-3A-like isoform X1 [Physeter catodon]
MEAGTAPRSRCLLDENTFTENFKNQINTRKTYLCYEVEIVDGDARVPLDEIKGFVHNKGANQPGEPCHAELYFLDRIHSWTLDRRLHYRLTCFISWTPCHTCAQELATFLGENSHVSLHIFASRMYRRFDYEAGLRRLQAAGAQIAIMTSKEFEHCWETFVDHQGRPFQPWDGLEVESQHLCKKLQEILQVRAPSCCFPGLPPSSPLLSSPCAFFLLSEPPLGDLLPPGAPAPSFPSFLMRSLYFLTCCVPPSFPIFVTLPRPPLGFCFILQMSHSLLPS